MHLPYNATGDVESRETTTSSIFLPETGNRGSQRFSARYKARRNFCVERIQGMSVLSDTWWLEHQECVQPFVPQKIRLENGNPVISYGLSSFGYDVRLGNTLLVPTDTISDPHHKTPAYKQLTMDRTWVLLPGHHVLAQTHEYIRVPSDVLGFVYGKSTYARLGLVVNTTPLEPAWEGVITLCLINPTLRPIVLHALQGIAQVVFMRGTQAPHVGYTGAYQGATSAMPPTITHT